MLIIATALVGTFAACQTSAAMQPTFAVSSANSNVFTFGGNVQSSMASSVVASTPWNIQVTLHTDLQLHIYRQVIWQHFRLSMVYQSVSF